MGLCEGNSPVTGEFSTHKGPVTRKIYPVDDVIMCIILFDVINKLQYMAHFFNDIYNISLRRCSTDPCVSPSYFYYQNRVYRWNNGTGVTSNISLYCVFIHINVGRIRNDNPLSCCRQVSPIQCNLYRAAVVIDPSSFVHAYACNTSTTYSCWGQRHQLLALHQMLEYITNSNTVRFQQSITMTS